MFRFLRLLIFLVIVNVAFVTSLARADDQSNGFYSSFVVGTSIFETMTFAEPATADLVVDPKIGWTVGGAVGYRLPHRVKLELDIGYSGSALKGTFENNVEAFIPCGEFPGNPCLDRNVDGDIRTLTAFASTYYDFPEIGSLKPFVGVGLGLVNVDLEVGSRATLNDGPVSRFDLVDSTETVLGYRGALGVASDIGPADISLTYAYMFTDRPSFDGQSPLVSFTFDRKIKSHALRARLTYNF